MLAAAGLSAAAVVENLAGLVPNSWEHQRSWLESGELERMAPAKELLLFQYYTLHSLRYSLSDDKQGNNRTKVDCQSAEIPGVETWQLAEWAQVMDTAQLNSTNLFVGIHWNQNTIKEHHTKSCKYCPSPDVVLCHRDDVLRSKPVSNTKNCSWLKPHDNLLDLACMTTSVDQVCFLDIAALVAAPAEYKCSGDLKAYSVLRLHCEDSGNFPVALAKMSALKAEHLMAQNFVGVLQQQAVR